MVQSSIGRWLQYLLTVVALFGLVYLFLVMIQPYRFSAVLAEKHGRVIDAKTGEGLPNVAVIVNYALWSSTPTQAGYSGCIHQKIVWTDAGGNYVIPSASKDIDVAEEMLWRMLPGFSRSYGWMLDYYKEGYVETRHLERMIDLVERRPELRVGRTAPYAKYGPSYGSLVKKWVDPPVQMRRIDMASSPIMADAYITSVDSSAQFLQCSLYDERNIAASVALRKEIKASIRKLICDLPSDKVLSEVARRGDFYDCAAGLGIKKVSKGKSPGAALTTGELCEAFSYVPEGYECQSLESRKAPPLQIVPYSQHQPSN